MLMLLFLPGCIMDDMSDCPVVVLEFSYPDSKGADQFKDKIGSVVVGVFEKSGRLIHSQTIGKAALERSQKYRFMVPEGDYRVVCWGNLSEYSKLSPMRYGVLLSDSYLTLDARSPKRGSDPVMYAPRPASQTRADETGDAFLLTVPYTGTVEKTIDFTSAHTDFSIIVKGLADIDGDAAPEVAITGLPTGYDFDMKAFGNTETYRDNTRYTNTAKGPEAWGRIYTGNFAEGDPVTVGLYSGADGRVLKTVNLSEYLAEDEIDFFKLRERSVTIIFKFEEGKEVDVTISLSPWTGEDVSPEW